MWNMFRNISKDKNKWLKYDTKELCKNWKLDCSMEAVLVAAIEKHFLKYCVQHIEKYSKKQTKN